MGYSKWGRSRASGAGAVPVELEQSQWSRSSASGAGAEPVEPEQSQWSRSSASGAGAGLSCTKEILSLA